MSTFLPNSYQTPNIWMDVVNPYLTSDEWRVLTYTHRHVYGWQDTITIRQRRISVSAYENGINGYPGCGLSKPTIIKVLNNLSAYGVLIRVGDPTEQGQLWEIPKDIAQINMDGLRQRLEEKQDKSKRRTSKARRINPKNGATGQSDLPVANEDTPVNATDQLPVNATDQPRSMRLTESKPLSKVSSQNQSLPGVTNVVSTPENTQPAEPDLTVFKDTVENLDMGELEENELVPDPLNCKVALQRAVSHTWGTDQDNWGGWNGLMRNFLTGHVDAKNKHTLWDKFKIDDPPMSPVEIMGFGLWYHDEFPDQGQPPKSLELLDQRIALFRVSISYERGLEVGREDLQKLMGIEDSPRDESDRITAADEQEIDDALQAALAAMGGIQS